jgi:hypothetical protein
MPRCGWGSAIALLEYGYARCRLGYGLWLHDRLHKFKGEALE